MEGADDSFSALSPLGQIDRRYRLLLTAEAKMTAKSIANQFGYIEFPAKDIDQLKITRHFYSSAFGWNYNNWGDDYADTTSSGLGSGINADPEHRPSYPLAVIYTADLESMQKKVVTAGGKITKEIFSFPGGRRFHFKDPADNELAVWSDQA